MGVGGDIGSILGKVGGDALGAWLGFKTGGRVPGKKGAPRKAIVHAGEYVLPVGVKPTKAQVEAVKKRKDKK
jgi:hypothetical protein